MADGGRLIHKRPLAAISAPKTFFLRASLSSRNPEPAPDAAKPSSLSTSSTIRRTSAPFSCDREVSEARRSLEARNVKCAVLAAIKDLFAAQHTNRLGSKAIVEALTADPTARWSESNRGRTLSEAQLARLLRPFEIYPTSFGAARDYRLSEGQDAFARYVAPDEVAETVKGGKTCCETSHF